MNNLIKKINKTDINYKLNLTYIDYNHLINLILTNPALKKQNKLIINDIKEINDKQKIILNIFINEYSNLYPIISKYNKYIYIGNKEVNLLNSKPVFRGFFNASNIIKLSENDLNGNILQIGILPTFLEAIHKLNNSKKLNFIRINSQKVPPNQTLYDTLINRFKEYNTININNFYYTEINKLLDNKQLTKYDLIVFDTYKNMYNFPIDDVQSNINTRYLLAILNSKYIYHQLMFGLNKLNENGTLILLLPGSNYIVYQQLITIISTLFNEVVLVNSDFDYSYRYYLIAKQFKPNEKLISELTVDISKDNILINILDESTKILDVNFENNLQNKFNNINSNIAIIEEMYGNQQLVNKIYNNNYYNQLNNTYKWLKQIFNKKDINNDVNNMLLTSRETFLVKLKEKQQIEEFKLFKSIKDTLNFVGENINNTDFSTLIHYINYIVLLDIIGYNKNMNYTYDTFIDTYKKYNNVQDVNYLINKYNLIDPLYVEYTNEINIFNNLKNNIIIKFDIIKMCPLLLSIINILTIIYKSSLIIRVDNDYYYIAMNLNKKIDLTNFLELYNDNIKNVNNDYLIAMINEDFIDQINKIFNKLFIDHLMSIIRYKFLL